MRLAAAITIVPFALLSACASPAPPPWESLPTLATAAVVQATEQHAPALARADAAGLWIAQDSQGRLIASGVLNPMPTSFSSDELYTVFPRQSGQRIERFGFARTAPATRRASVRLLYAEFAAIP